VEDLRYPVGQFDPAGPLPAEQRTAMIESIEAAPKRLREAVSGLSDQQLDTPYRDGGWTVRQVTHHVADSHMNAYIRMRWALTEDSPLIKVYEQKDWAELPDARTAPVELSLNLLDALHARWVTFLRALMDSDYQRAIQHPEMGRMTVSALVRMYEWHGRHHVAHIKNLRQRMKWD
jgi:uncharacterized damage-inducible protein DinB